MKKNLMTVALFVASLATTAQTQNSANPNSSSPFPFQTDAQKQEWINANPKAYVNMGGDKGSVQTTTMPEFTTQAEKEAWLVQQETLMMNQKENAPLFANEAQKDAWINAYLTGKPVKVNTGNKVADEMNYNNAKQLYIEQNKAAYNNESMSN